MIKVSVLYANCEGGRFDCDNYCTKHIPLVKRLLGPAIKGVAVEQGIGGQTPGSTAPFLAVGHLLFDSLEAFQSAFGAHAEKIMSDIPNDTNVQPTIQVGEVKT